MRRPFYGAIQHLGIAGPTTFTDTFTDTAGTLLTAHVSNSGQTWAFGFGSAQTSPAQIQGTDVWSPATSTREYVSSWTPVSSDYYVESVVKWYSTITDNIGLTGRHQASEETFYLAHWSSAAGGWRLLKAVAGTVTQIGSTLFADTFTSGTRTVRLTMTGTTIKVTIDGTDRITEVDSSITLPGTVGIRFAAQQASGTGRHFDSITAVG